MIGKFKISQRWIGAAISVLLALALGFVLDSKNYKFGSGLRNLSYDLLLVARGDVVANEALIVFLDEESHREMGQHMNKAWDRAIHAQLVDRLAAAGARSVTFDVIFNEPSTQEADQQFANSLKKSGNVILAADHVPTLRKANQFDRPIDLFLDAEAGLGSAELEPDSDLIVRQHPPNTPREIVPSLSWATAEFVKAPIALQPGADGAERWINYYGRPDWLPHVSYFQLFGPNPPDHLIRGKVVFVGARMLTKFAADRKDEYVNPFGYWLGREDPRKFIAGVEIQATAFLNLLRGDWLSRLPDFWERAIILLLGSGFGFGLISLRPSRATVVAFAGCALVAAASFLAFKTTLVWFPWLIPIIQICTVLIWSIVFNSIQLYVQKKLLEQTLVMHLPPRLVAKYVKDPGRFLKPGAEKQMLTILFSDIANFTTITENLEGHELAAAMNNYFQSAVSGCIHKTDGTVVKYIGDAIFAFWNAPDQQSDHTVRACEAAVLFRQQRPHYIRGTPLHTRIGLHTGVAQVGNFGSTERVDYTALGENINLASRMEGLNKYLGTELLITGDTKAGIHEEFTTRFLGLFRLKGFEKSVEVYELIARGDQKEATKPWRDAFAEALQQFQKRNFDAAEAGFRRTLELKPEDGPSKFLLARIADLRSETLPKDWCGEIELKEK